ncbi:hypothetical protein HPB47_003911 [Ixodes persulcatus]|uniref:Uncharacterized protein n=1 Tax=Ixodes persulcatus TaxID=34615 RepID=A0AC60PHB2_IXOPE|nr:hypothetical protein HPB47_003911 [Ixodes persulcatus]
MSVQRQVTYRRQDDGIVEQHPSTTVVLTFQTDRAMPQRIYLGFTSHSAATAAKQLSMINGRQTRRRAPSPNPQVVRRQPRPEHPNGAPTKKTYSEILKRPHKGGRQCQHPYQHLVDLGILKRLPPEHQQSTQCQASHSIHENKKILHRYSYPCYLWR